MIVLGIDPGLKHTGWGVIEQRGSTLRCLAYGCITTQTGRPDAERLAEIHAGITAVIERFEPSETAIESVYFSNNAKTAFATGQARGVAILAAAAMPVGEYGPGEIKLAVVGAGDASKHQVQYMVRAILGLPREPEPHHAADALAAAICHANCRVVRAAGRGGLQ
ncbi:crossover junction endodeoxyribonuclease RuvC [bacterium]|nr:crossover junction endodeoxyribonuclease RuvC [bacterium]